MTAHLLLVTLGPIQDFIAQARRTRDLWYGSHLLSELSRAAARALVDGGADLIFPALENGDRELLPCLAPLRAEGHPPLNIANKLLAEVREGIDPPTLARATRDAVQTFWRQDLSAGVKHRCGGLLAPGIDAAWDEQLATLLEFAATWAEVTRESYKAVRTTIEQAVSGRKNLRDFGPWRNVRGNVPKSSLDGARETVLRLPDRRERHLVRKYVITPAEELDAVGLVKRAGGEPDQFVPVINVALTTWLAHAEREAPRQLEALRNACKDLGLARVVREDLPCARVFPFDASVLLPDRWSSVFAERALDGDSAAWGRQHVRPLLDRVGEPYPYVACLVADGDRMGHAIDALASAEDHRKLSHGLAGFAKEARQIVEQQHRGSLVYAGGDDVLAFLPLPEALACADALRCSFATTMQAVTCGRPGGAPPTLSVGLGIGHVMESMGTLLKLGRDAEELAKRGPGGSDGRNALAVIVDKRSGGQRSWWARWEPRADDPDPVERLRKDAAHGTGGEQPVAVRLDPVERLHKDAALLANGGKLSTRKVYEIARTLQRLPAPAKASELGWAQVLKLEVHRSLSRVDADGGVKPADVGLFESAAAPATFEVTPGYATLHAEVSAWINRLLIARTFAMARPSRDEENTP